MVANLGVIDLFSGAGGSALGFQQSGFPIKVAVDLNTSASRSFKLNFPDCHVYTSDISYLSGKELLKAGGFNSGDQVILIACPPVSRFFIGKKEFSKINGP